MDNCSKKLILHIGLGKTSTSTLQALIFPELCRMLQLKYWGNEDIHKWDANISNYFVNLIERMWLDRPLERVNFLHDMLVSNEGLSSYRDAHRMIEYASKNRKVFGRRAHVLLVIREPKSWLTSLYIQRCVHENPVQKPEHFFLSETEYSLHLPDAKFNVERFSYIKLVEEYKKLFDTVTVVKYEALPKMDFLRELSTLTDEQLIKMRNLYSSRRVNKSLSSHTISLVFKFNKLLALFMLSYKPKYSNAVLLSRCNEEFLNETVSRVETSQGFRKLFLLFFSLFHYKFILCKVIDRILPHKKFQLNFSELKTIPIKSLELEYKNLPEVCTYQKVEQ